MNRERRESRSVAQTPQFHALRGISKGLKRQFLRKYSRGGHKSNVPPRLHSVSCPSTRTPNDCRVGSN